MGRGGPSKKKQKQAGDEGDGASENGTADSLPPATTARPKRKATKAAINENEDSADEFEEAAPAPAKTAKAKGKGKAVNKRQVRGHEDDDEEEQLVAALVNRLKRKDLETLLKKAVSNGAVPVDDIKVLLPEHHRALSIKTAVDITSKPLREGQVGLWAEIPNEIQLMIFAMLPFRDRFRAAFCVCRSWRELLQVDTLWDFCDFAGSVTAGKIARPTKVESVRRIFGVDAKGKKLKDVEPIIDPTFVKKIRYKCESDAIGVNDLKPLYKATPNVVDLELTGKNLTDAAVTDAAKAYSPNLQRIVVKDIKLKTFVFTSIIQQNPDLDDLTASTDYNFRSADFIDIAIAGQVTLPGGTASTSRLVSLDLDVNPSASIIALAQFGAWFPELEHLKFDCLSIGVNDTPSVIPFVEMPRLRTLTIRELSLGLYWAFQTTNGVQSQEKVNTLFRDFFTSLHGGCHRTLEELHVGVSVQHANVDQRRAGLQQPQPFLGNALVVPGGWPALKQLSLSQCKIKPGDLDTLEAPVLEVLMLATKVADNDRYAKSNQSKSTETDVRGAVESMKNAKGQQWMESQVGLDYKKLGRWGDSSLVLWRRVFEPAEEYIEFGCGWDSALFSA